MKEKYSKEPYYFEFYIQIAFCVLFYLILIVYILSLFLDLFLEFLFLKEINNQESGYLLLTILVNQLYISMIFTDKTLNSQTML